MLKRLIRNIRQKPKVVRDNIALGAAGVFTAVVSMVWLYHMPSKVESMAAARENKEQGVSFSDLFGKIGNQFAAVKEAVSTESATEDESEADAGLVGVEAVATSSVSVTTSTTSMDSSSSSVMATIATSSAATTTGEVFSDAPRTIRIIATKSTTSLEVASTTAGQ